MPQIVSFADIRPFIRCTQTMTIGHNYYASMIRAYDHRLFYILAGHGTIRVADRCCTAGPGSLFLWHSRHPYQLSADPGDDMQVVVVNFDYLQVDGQPDHSLPVVASEACDPAQMLEDVTFADLPAFDQPIGLDGLQQFEPELLAMAKEYAGRRILFRMRLSALFLVILTELARLAGTGAAGPEASGQVDRVISYIQEHCQEDLNNRLLGELFNYHPNYLNRLMLRHTGSPLHQYVLNCRISLALKLLQTTNDPVADICSRVGFKDFSYFSKYFRQVTGRSPTAYRNLPGQNLV